jgi:arylsulfatase A-like enzyme
VLPAGKVSTQQAILMDVAATVLAASRTAAADALDGMDLAPLLAGAASPRERTFCWRLGLSKAVRKGRWKYRSDSTERLFDIEADPGERLDVASQRPDVVKMLRAALTEWEAAVPSRAR